MLGAITNGDSYMRTTIVINILLLLAIFCGCAKKSNPVEPILPAEGIFGKWNWVKTVPREGDIPIITPGTAGFTKRYLFAQDSTFTAWKNDSIIYNGKYYIRRELNFMTSPDSGDVLRINGEWFSDGHQWIINWHHRDTLQLLGLCFDCADQLFSRIP